MATYTFDKIEYGGNNYIVQDSGALQLTGGQVTGPVSFGDGITVDEATLGDLVVNGSASFTNNLQANTINGVTVGNSPVFTDSNVTQTATTTNAAYEILFSGTADNTTRTEGAGKSNRLTFNPSTKALSVTGPVYSYGINSSISDSDGDHSTSITQTYSQLQLSGYHDSNSGTGGTNLSISNSIITLASNHYDEDEDETYKTSLIVHRNYIALRDADDNECIEVSDGGVVSIYNLRTPTANTDAATKKYVDDSVGVKIGGSGTSGYLAKFDGTRSLTNGPQLGSATTTFLRNDGTWATPAGTTYTAGTGLGLSSNEFSVKLGYTTSGNNRAVQADSNGNLYVVQKDDNSNTTYTLTNALSSHKFTWTLTPSSGSATTTTAELVAGSNITLTDDTTNKKITIAATDTTYSVVSKTANGLAPQLPNETATTKFLRQDGSWAVPSYTTNTDEKLKVAEVTSGTQYFPIVGTGTLAATRQYDTTGFVYIGRTGTTSTVGDATLVLGNSTASGTAGNKRGELHIFGKNSHYAYIILGEPSSDIQLNLPITDGTLALTSDIPSNIVTGTGTSGYLAKFNGTSTITNGPQLGNGTTTFLRNDGSWATPTETDPTVPSWAKEVNKPSYSANEISGLLDFFYPVGSYYETSDTTFDPNTSWGGTWELEAAGQVHVSAGTGYTVAGALTNTTDGGSKDAIIPSHNHTATGAAVAKHSATACSRTTNVGLDNNHNVSVTNSRTTTESGGGSHSHSPSTTTRSFLTATTSGISINRSNIKNGTGTQYDGCLRVGSACAYNGSTDSVSISHSHYFTPSVSVTVKGHNITQPAFSTPELTHTVTQPTISTEGVSVTGKNMQPYIIVNRWHRTA